MDKAFWRLALFVSIAALLNGCQNHEPDPWVVDGHVFDTPECKTFFVERENLSTVFLDSLVHKGKGPLKARLQKNEEAIYVFEKTYSKEFMTLDSIGIEFLLKDATTSSDGDVRDELEISTDLAFAIVMSERFGTDEDRLVRFYEVFETLTNSAEWKEVRSTTTSDSWMSEVHRGYASKSSLLNKLFGLCAASVTPSQILIMQEREVDDLKLAIIESEG